MAANVEGSRRFWRYCLVLMLAGAVVLGWLSLLTFSPTDPPSPVVHPPKYPVDNAAGIVGAHLSHFIRYWLGGGAYMGLLFLTVAAFVMVLGGRIADLPWRLAGLALLITATSSAVYLLKPVSGAGAMNGSAGILGIGAGQLLFAKFGHIGAWIILMLVLCTGLMLTADKFVLRIPHFGRKVWANRGELPRMVGALRPRLVTAEAQCLTAAPRAVAAVPATSVRPAS
ncbi:MAG: DNA translocase FtsK 4TM domain-containing protein, partial [Phycisphaerae bacterium]|nr:DNA translocase FtsK 4TM domain-containing protein [Phycisphaerae bacterium]